jgi:arginase family enzyme
MSAAGMALWLAAQPSAFRAGPSVAPSQTAVIGWSDDLRSPPLGLRSVPLAEVRRQGPEEAARQALAAIPASAPILLHLDIDVMSRQEMPAAYFPHADGLGAAECRELLRPILADPRLALLEVAEYASLRDLDQVHVGRLVDLLVESM